MCNLSSVFRFCLYSLHQTGESCVLCVSLVQLEVNIYVIRNNPSLPFSIQRAALHVLLPPSLATSLGLCSSFLWQISNMDDIQPYLDRFGHSFYILNERHWLNIPDMPSSPGCIIQVRLAVTMSKLSAQSLTIFDIAGICVSRWTWLYQLAMISRTRTGSCQVIAATPPMHIALSTISLPCRSILSWWWWIYSHKIRRLTDHPV